LEGGAAAHTVVKKSTRTLRDDAFACRKTKNSKANATAGHGYGIWGLDMGYGIWSPTQVEKESETVPPVGQITRTIC